MDSNVSQSFSELKRGEYFTTVISHIMVSLMMGCVSISLVQLAERIFTEWSGNYLTILVVFISAERILTHSMVEKLDQEPKVLYHSAEWVTIAAGLRLFLFSRDPTGNLFERLSELHLNLSILFTGEYISVLIVLLMAWLFSGSFVRDLEELRLDKLDLSWELGILENRRQVAREAIINRILVLGIFMVFFGVLTRVDIQSLFGPYEALQAPVINILVYFIFALILFSQTQFNVLRGRWMWNKIPISQSMGRKWLLNGVIFLGIILLLAYLLPTRYTFGLLDLVRVIVSTGISIVLFISALLAIPFGWLLSLIPNSRTIQEPLESTDLPPIIPQPVYSTPNPTLQLIQTILFWSFFIGLVIFSVIYYFRINAQSVNSLRIGEMIKSVKGFITQLFTWFHGRALIIKNMVSSVYKYLINVMVKSPGASKLVFPNFNRLNSNQKIIFFYMRFLDRARASGIPRKPHQTPSQFTSTIDQALPDLSPELAKFTGAFQLARYSNHASTPEESAHVIVLWNKIVRSLKEAGKQDANRE